MDKNFLEINEQIKELEEKLEQATSEEVETLDEEINKLMERKSQAIEERKQEIKEKITRGMETIKKQQTNTEEMEQRAKDINNGRAVVLSRALPLKTQGLGSGIVLEQKVSDTINQDFKNISDLINLVNYLKIDGGESFSQPYAKGNTTGDYTQEAAAYASIEPQFDYALISKSKITAYTELSEEYKVLPSANYVAHIEKELNNSLDQKLSREILHGDGTQGHLTGILSEKAKAIDPTSDLKITAIDENTLDNIVLSYGGKEEFTPAYLILNKQTLKEFAKVRGTDKRKVYDIDYQNKTIDGVPYILNQHMPTIENAKSGTVKYFLVYGSPENYTLANFSNETYAESKDYKFKEGIISFKVNGFYGGNVNSYNGFLRVKVKD